MEGNHGPARLSIAERAALLDRVPDIVWRYRVIPPAGFEYVTPSALVLTGYSPAEHYADPDLGRKIVHPDDLPLLEAAMAAPGDHKQMTLRWRHKAGLELVTEQRVITVRDRTGEVVAIEGVARPVISGERALQIAAGDLVVDLATHRVLVNHRAVVLTPSEHRILVLLASAGGPVAAPDLITRLWGDEDPAGPRVVQVHVSNLRRKIEDDPSSPRRLVTHRGVGYELAR